MPSKAERPKVPRFNTEAEEADWWDAHMDMVGDELMKAIQDGTAQRGVAERLSREARQSWEARARRYAIVIKKNPAGNLSAHVPDLPGCLATADTLDELKRLIQEAIEVHVEGMRKDGKTIPEPTTEVDYIAAPAV
jgi:predicted RNase H-like HicB family nuclease